MSGFDVNNKINPSQSNTPKPTDRQEGVTREQFIINIFGSADKAKASHLANNAGSIFDQLDNSPKDGILSQTEANKGTQIISALQKMMTSAFGSTTEAEKFNSLPLKEQLEKIQGDLGALYKLGNRIVEFDGDNITIRDNAGNEVDISLSQAGISPEVIKNLQPTIEETIVSKSFEMAGYDSYDRLHMNLMGVKCAPDAEGNLLFSMNGEQFGSVKYNENGQPIYDEGAQDMNFALTRKKYEAVGFEYKDHNMDQENGVLTIVYQKDNQEKVVKIDINTGKEVTE